MCIPVCILKVLQRDLFIYNLLDYIHFIPPKIVKIYSVMSVFSELLIDINEIHKIPLVKTFDSNMSKKINKNFETDFIQCLDFCTRKLWKFVHISLNNKYLNFTNEEENRGSCAWFHSNVTRFKVNNRIHHPNWIKINAIFAVFNAYNMHQMVIYICKFTWLQWQEKAM